MTMAATMEIFRLECAHQSLYYFDGKIGEDWENVPRMQEAFSKACSATLEVSIYSGFASGFGGGRESMYSHLDPATLPATVDRFNQRGISFHLALNGGLSLPEYLHPDDLCEKSLDFLQEQNARCGTHNGVIVTHAGLASFVKRHYPGLHRTASCIHALDPRNIGGYDLRVRSFDAVCIPNQQSAPAFLSNFPDKSKALLLLNSPCAAADPYACYAHYANIEEDALYASMLVREAHLDKETYRLRFDSQFGEGTFQIVSSVVGPEDRTTDHRCCQRTGAALVMRPRDLASLVSLGVRRFKWGRGDQFETNLFRQFIKSVQEASF